MKDFETEAMTLLIASSESNYRIAKNTGITEATIGNYRNGKTTPTKANAMLLLKYFSESHENNKRGATPRLEGRRSNECELCLEKERTIQILSERIEELKETISILREERSTKRHSA